MTHPNPQRLRNELVMLLDLQLSTLEREVFGVITVSEILEYERRQDRICELYSELFGEHAAAA